MFIINLIKKQSNSSKVYSAVTNNCLPFLLIRGLFHAFINIQILKIEILHKFKINRVDFG